MKITMKHNKYPLPMMILHHIVAILMIATYFLADYIKLHKSLGGLLLIFVCLRLAVRFMYLGKTPPSINPPQSIHYKVEKSVHGMMYLLMIVQPLMGWTISNGKGYPVNVFGLFSFPTIVGINEKLSENLYVVHELLGKVLFALLIAHVVGGLYHLYKEKQNIFTRMIPYYYESMRFTYQTSIYTGV